MQESAERWWELFCSVLQQMMGDDAEKRRCYEYPELLDKAYIVADLALEKYEERWRGL